MENSRSAKGATSKGIDTREQINQGFVRSELASGADDKASSVYDRAFIDGVSPALLQRLARNAVENYMAAISCFLRAIPGVKDTRSKRLIRTEVNKLLLRLEGMRRLASEANRLVSVYGEDAQNILLRPEDRIDLAAIGFDPTALRDEFDEDLADAFDQLTIGDDQDEDEGKSSPVETQGMHDLGTQVEVLRTDGTEWAPAVIAGHDARDQYRVLYADGEQERNVAASRIRLPMVEDSLELSAEDEARVDVMSEILESERRYNLDLHNLLDYYVHVLRNPAHWGGQKMQVETIFTQKTVGDDEAKAVFANIEDIYKMNHEFLGSLEASFKQMRNDQSLASTFVLYASRFEIYAEYVVQFEESQRLIADMRKKRGGFVSADEAAAIAHVPPLAELMKRPLQRIDEYINLLRKLQARTSSNHPSIVDINRAVEIFHSIQVYVKKAEKMRENQKEIMRLQERFSPSITLVKSGRILLHMGDLQRMEKGNPKKRHFWLFNDMILCARDSEWLNRGSYRHKGSMALKSFGETAEYGPNAFFVKGKTGEQWVLIGIGVDTKNEWLQKLALCPHVINEIAQVMDRSRETLRLRQEYGKQHPGVTRTMGTKSFQPVPPPPPPPLPRQDELPPGWVKLQDPSTGKDYFYNESQQITQWDKPTV